MNNMHTDVHSTTFQLRRISPGGDLDIPALWVIGRRKRGSTRPKRLCDEEFDLDFVGLPRCAFAYPKKVPHVASCIY